MWRRPSGGDARAPIAFSHPDSGTDGSAGSYTGTDGSAGSYTGTDGSAGSH
jgi:hypothetical protein